jgi:hypothetical protein
MSEALVLCSGCSRHVREHERACPFCRVVRAPSRAAALLAGAVFAGALSQNGELHSQPLGPRLTMDHAPAQGYGAPPSYDRMAPLEPPAPAAPVAPVTPAQLRARVTVTGLSSSATAPLLSAVYARRAALARCLNLAEAPEQRSAALIVEFALTPAGRVGFLRLDDRDERFARCVVATLRTLRVRLATPVTENVTGNLVLSVAAPPPRSPRRR